MRRVILVGVIAAVAVAALAATAGARTESRFTLIETAKSQHRAGNHTITHGVLALATDPDDIIGTDRVKFNRKGNIHARAHFGGGTIKAQGNVNASRILIVGGSGRWNGAAGKINFRSLSRRKTLLRFAIVQ
jgi:hypothetical protein